LTFAFFSLGWCGLNWSSWIKLKAERNERKVIGAYQGVYRVRPHGQDFLVYIGQTNNLQRRTANLARHSYKDEMPWNDPHTAAPNLWAWRKEEGWDYEVSVAATPELTRQNREGLECLLLWKYRLEKGESALCNHGRFHPDYIKSSDKAKGRKGRKLDSSEPRNPAGGASYQPLKPLKTHTSTDWMGLPWTEFRNLETATILPTNPGVYKIVDSNNQELLYVGETDNLINRLNAHRRMFSEVAFSYSKVSPHLSHHQRLEIENDLIGCYYYLKGKSPSCQFKREKNFRSS
jgi:predicted GIY-YIG superfamily endonuclease